MLFVPCCISHNFNESVRNIKLKNNIIIHNISFLKNIQISEQNKFFFYSIILIHDSYHFSCFSLSISNTFSFCIIQHSIHFIWPVEIRNMLGPLCPQLAVKKKDSIGGSFECKCYKKRAGPIIQQGKIKIPPRLML